MKIQNKYIKVFVALLLMLLVFVPCSIKQDVKEHLGMALNQQANKDRVTTSCSFLSDTKIDETKNLDSSKKIRTSHTSHSKVLSIWHDTLAECVDYLSFQVAHPDCATPLFIRHQIFII